MSNSEQTVTHGISSLLVRILNPARRMDYFLLFVFAFIPIVWARTIGIHYVADESLRGYWERPNWWGLCLIIPLALFLLRTAISRISPVANADFESNPPPLLSLARSPEARQPLYESLRRSMLAPFNLWLAIVLALSITVVDSWQWFFYFRTPAASQLLREAEWQFICLVPQGNMPTTDWWSALAFTAYAYMIEFTAILIGWLFIILLARHNIFFLASVYQRRDVTEGEEDIYFEIDIYDPNRCFGFRHANSAFNWQIFFLIAGGSLLLVSRIYNAGRMDTVTVTNFEFFTSPGQYMLALSWLLALSVVMLPALVKHLPLLPRRHCGPIPQTMLHYLHEYIPDEKWPFVENQRPKESALRALAGQFARNSFWPTGDHQASFWFTCAYMVCLIMLFPVQVSFTNKYFVPLAALYLVVLFGLAYLMKTLFFLFLSKSLAYIDPALVTPLANGTDQQLPQRRFGKLGCKVFINYRRSDSKAYAGHLHRTLREHLKEDQIFIDIEDIDPGVNFSDAIDSSLTEIDALIVLIGPTWLNVEDKDGNRRLDAPRDYVRGEIECALQRGISIFPLLVGGATMPPGGFLPPSIADLSMINAIEITDERWDYDVGRLIEVLQKLSKDRSEA